jgi:hypothetical protein
MEMLCKYLVYYFHCRYSFFPQNIFDLHMVNPWKIDCIFNPPTVSAQLQSWARNHIVMVTLLLLPFMQNIQT